MTSPNDTYTSPLAERNASPEMLRLWSPRHKFNTWRRIWLAVAEAQHELTRAPSVSERVGDSRTQDPVAHALGSLKQGSPGPGAPTHELVTKEQVEELRAVVARGITDAEIELAKKYERELRHDVMAHVHALGDSCPKAKGIIHLGMTSQDVVCNADLFTIHQCLSLIRTKLARLVISLGTSAVRFVEMPTLGFTHFQPAQPVSVGRRMAGWATDVELTRRRVISLHPFGYCHGGGSYALLPFRGIRGATGTQASLLALGLSPKKIEDFENAVLHRVADTSLPGFKRNNAVEAGGIPEYPLGIDEPVVVDPWKQDLGEPIEVYLWGNPLTGQTYPRVMDTFIMADLASVGAVLHKIATDIRLLCNRKEIDEPFEDKQIGSSAMPYKRNPMRCERICGLTRFVMNLVGNAYDTAATQWLERTLDDSSNRRLSLPEAFLALDGALDLMHNVASGLIVHEATVRKNLMAELPFMATENILMACVKLGGDRQQYHELIRQHAQVAGLRVKDEGKENDLLERLQGDRNFWSKARGGPLSAELDWSSVLDPMNYIGRSVEQTERFISEVVEPLRKQYGQAIAGLGDSAPKV